MEFEWISATTDYGTEDGFVAACVGVIAQLAPHANLIHVTHDVPPGDIRRGATVLAHTAPYLPPAVHLAVVDPGVGTARRGIAVVTGQGILVGPDNGLLLPATEALGGPTAAYELTDPAYWLPDVSHTFHGRDIFAPVTAYLATGIDPTRLGPALDVTQLVHLPRPHVHARPGELTAEVLTVDRFGNVQLAATPADLAAARIRQGARIQLTAGDLTLEAFVGTTFADAPPGALVVLIDSANHIAIAINTGSAAEGLAIHPTQLVCLQVPPTRSELRPLSHTGQDDHPPQS